MERQVLNMLIKTEYANFGNPKDLLRYMQEENILECTVTYEYWGAKLLPMKMTQQDVKEWIQIGEEQQ